MGSCPSSQCKIRQCSRCQGDTEYYCNTCNHDLCLRCKERHVIDLHTKHQCILRQCIVRQCFQCQGDTEFHCNTCKLDLCLPCKEGHVIDLDTMYHDVVIYREKYKYIPSLSHPKRMYNKYCSSCKLPLCSKFEKQKHKRHEMLSIIKAYTTNREQYRNIVHRIRGEILCKNQFLLADIKSDLKSDKTDILNFQLKISNKAQTLKDLIVTEMYAANVKYKLLMIHKLQQQKRKINRQFASIENLDHRFEHSTNRPLKFLYFIKNTNVPKIKDTCNFKPLSLLPLTEEIEINVEALVEFLSEIHMIERGQRQVRDEDLLDLMPTPVLHKTVKLKLPGHVTNISRLNSEQIWITTSSMHDFSTLAVLTNAEGDILHQLRSEAYYVRYSEYGAHTVNIRGELIYIGTSNSIYKLSNDNKTRTTLKKGTDPLKPLCVYSSHVDGHLLVGMFSVFENICTINRYNSLGQYIKTIQRDKKGQQLYRKPSYITENRNGDVIVSDRYRGVVVTDRGGGHRFSYTGPPSGSRSRLVPRGICTDALSNILVCYWITNTVHMIDKDGHFLSNILTGEQGINRPHSLNYDNKSHLLWVGSCGYNPLRVYRYIKESAFRQVILDDY
ncbi:uncharacterized protein LOC134270729 [Saccostrea cucullata]|uniref:uncharacterized protein LOC134270729 n=1 Tax=Saccostrea cuccullata TaxID=36930 RepID=UPI002ED2F9B9